MEKFEKITTKIIKSIFDTLFVLLVLIAIILIYNIIQLSIFNKPYMNIFGYSIFQVKTGSMSKTLEIEDIIIVKLTKDVEKNDIVTFMPEEKTIITHRIVKMEENEIITKGDANNIEDNPITTENIIGKVVFTFKNVAIWKQVFTTPQVCILIIVTLGLFGASISIKDSKKE